MKTRFFCALLLFSTVTGDLAGAGKPNILFITVDDMNWDSVGAYGCPIPEITPNIDLLAAEGMRFERGYVQSSNCSPSRGVFQSGRYPHRSGMRGFYMVDANYPLLPEVLRENDYYTAAVNKPRDTSFTDDYAQDWDHAVVLKEAAKRGAVTYRNEMDAFFEQVENSGKPFYCVVNIADPHKPFFNDPKSTEMGFDEFGPSRAYTADEVEVPGFLPKHPGIRIEIRNYYNSVKRADDCVGAILESLESSGHRENTAIVFASDHGMPLPFAKSSLYQNGIRVPWIVAWPGEVEAGSVDRDHFVSAVDFMPTILGIAGIPEPSGLQGRSFVPLLKGETQNGRDRVFAEFNENAIGLVFPMRAVHTAKFAYVFNPWSDGERKFSSASSSHKSYKTMEQLAETDAAVARRFETLIHREQEELYDLENDPDCLHNLASDPAHGGDLARLRAMLTKHMEESGDDVLEALQHRDSPEKLARFMEEQDQQSVERANIIQWKRHKNRLGGTGKNTRLFDSPANR